LRGDLVRHAQKLADDLNGGSSFANNKPDANAIARAVIDRAFASLGISTQQFRDLMKDAAAEARSLTVNDDMTVNAFDSGTTEPPNILLPSEGTQSPQFRKSLEQSRRVEAGRSDYMLQLAGDDWYTESTPILLAIPEKQ